MPDLRPTFDQCEACGLNHDFQHYRTVDPDLDGVVVSAVWWDNVPPSPMDQFYSYDDYVANALGIPRHILEADVIGSYAAAVQSIFRRKRIR